MKKTLFARTLFAKLKILFAKIAVQSLQERVILTIAQIVFLANTLTKKFRGTASLVARA